MLDAHRARRAALDTAGMGQSDEDMGDEALGYKPNPTLLENPNNLVKMILPGVIPYTHISFKCTKRVNDTKHEECARHKVKGESLRWRHEQLKVWRQELNLPARLTDLRSLAMRLQLYGDQEEAERLRKANTLIQQLPVSADDITAEEQLQMLGMAASNEEAEELIDKAATKEAKEVMQMQTYDDTGRRVRAQLYDAPDPEEDAFAKTNMEELAMLAAQTQRSVLLGNAAFYGNATAQVVNETRAFFQDGILPENGLDVLDHMLLKKIGMLFHCGSDQDMFIRHRNISENLWCAMRVHLMNETELNVFCPAKNSYWEQSCQNVAFQNFTAISVENEMNVIEAFRNSIGVLLNGFPTTVDEDEKLLKTFGYKPKRLKDDDDDDDDDDGDDDDDDDDGKREGGGAHDDGNRGRMGPILTSAVQLRLREKYLLRDALSGLDVYEKEVEEGKVEYQLEQKMKERQEQDAREKVRRELVAEIKKRSNESLPLVVVPVDIEGVKEGEPKAQNLTLMAGSEIAQTVRAFCVKFNIAADGMKALEAAIRTRVKALPRAPPSVLTVGVVGPDGSRHILGIPEGSNYTMETSIFCDKYGLDGVDFAALPVEMGGAEYEQESQCGRLNKLVRKRLDPQYRSFARPPLVTVSVDSPDGRTLTLVVWEGEQHNLLQTVSDFLQLHRIQSVDPLPLAEEVNRRLPSPVLNVPVALENQRTVMLRFCDRDNITNVVHAFADYYSVGTEAIDTLHRRGVYGMKPGSFLV